MDAILNRLSLDRANPIDLLNLKKSLQSIVEITDLIEKE
jgi:DNA mismatch repair ATPase MutS